MYIHPVPPVLNETRALVMMYNDFYRQAIQDLQGNVHPPPAPVCHPVVPFLGLTPIDDCVQMRASSGWISSETWSWTPRPCVWGRR